MTTNKIPDLSSDPAVVAALRDGGSVRVELASFHGSTLTVLIEPEDDGEGYQATAEWVRPDGSRCSPWA